MKYIKEYLMETFIKLASAFKGEKKNWKGYTNWQQERKVTKSGKLGKDSRIAICISGGSETPGESYQIDIFKNDKRRDDRL